MKKFTKKLWCIVLAACLVFSAMAGFQHETVTVSAEDAADETYERLEGNESAGMTPKSQEYSMQEKNFQITFHVKAITNAYLFIELRQGDDYITATTEPAIWTWPRKTAETGPTQLTMEKTDNSFNNFEPDKEYTIIVTRKDYEEEGADKTDYEIVIKDSTTDNTYAAFSAKNSVLTGEASLYLMARNGSFEMSSDSVPKPQPQSHGTDRTKR